jgi:2OG-Fe(II) oxygenase superfamily
MPQAPAEGIMSFLKHKITLPESPADLHLKYQSAKPFPHVVIDNMFSSEVLENIIREIPRPSVENWVDHDDEHITKSNLRSAIYLGETGYQHVSFVHSAAFLYLISEITGIWALVPDPYLGGSGYHVVPQGGKFDLHADRNIDQTTGLARRLAMITYLNQDWKPDYGGQLELWNSDATRCEASIVPQFNRTVIFEVGDKYFHGVHPVTGTAGRTRKSFVFYFHTVGLKGSSPHSSIYAPSFYAKETPVKNFLRDLVPPVLLKAVRRVKSSY